VYRWQASLPSRFARAALAKRDATAAVIGAGDFIGSAIAKTSRDAGSTKSAKATGFSDR